MGGKNKYEGQIGWEDVAREQMNQLHHWRHMPQIRIVPSVMVVDRYIVEISYLPAGVDADRKATFTYRVQLPIRSRAELASPVLRILHEAEAAWTATPWLWPDHLRKAARGDG